MKMKKFAIVLALVLAAGFSFGASPGSAQMGPGMMDYYGMGPGMMGYGYQGGYGPQGGYGGGYCPWCGRYSGPYGGYGMGPGMMGGYGMGPGMMGGYGMGPGMMGQGYGYYGPQSGYGPRYQMPQKPLSKEEATQEAQDYLKSTRNPNLKLGAVQEKGNDFQVDIVTKDGSLVDQILVNKDTGWMRPAY